MALPHPLRLPNPVRWRLAPVAALLRERRRLIALVTLATLAQTLLFPPPWTQEYQATTTIRLPDGGCGGGFCSAGTVIPSPGPSPVGALLIRAAARLDHTSERLGWGDPDLEGRLARCLD